MGLNFKIIDLFVTRTKNPQVFMFTFQLETKEIYKNHLFLSYEQYNNMTTRDEQQNIDYFILNFKPFIEKTINNETPIFLI